MNLWDNINVWGMILKVLALKVFLIMAAAPNFSWEVLFGWQWKDARPADGAGRIIRVIGIVGAVVMFIWICLAIQIAKDPYMV